MIDTHCHLEQPDYDQDRDVVIVRCRRQLQAVITSCANPKYFDLTMTLVNENKGFVFASASIHPAYVKELSTREIEEYIETIRSNRDNIVAIGETGLDYSWVTETKWQEKQKQLFTSFITLAEQLQLPLVIHSRGAAAPAINILEEYDVKKVQMHMFTSRSLLRRVLDNGWFISVNTLLLRSKTVRKIVRDCPIECLMLETDSPWLGIGDNGNIKPKNEVRNEPTVVNLVSKRIALIKKIEVKEVDRQTTRTARDFFKLQF